VKSLTLPLRVALVPVLTEPSTTLWSRSRYLFSPAVFGIHHLRTKHLQRGAFFCLRFFFQAEDGIRDDLVTGVQTCALPISVIRWNSGNGSSAQRELTAIPYNQEYKDDLTRAAGLLKEADLTENASLKKFLSSRADAFLSNDYYDSDIAWMDLDAPLDVTIGPYEVYNDELFNYKAAFEAFINLRDDAETKKFSVLANHLQEIENSLPIDPHYRNPKLGAAAPTE